MNFKSIIKNSVTDICREVKKDENMNIIKEDILNPVVKHVIMQISPYFFKLCIVFSIFFILIVILMFLNLRIIYK